MLYKKYHRSYVSQFKKGVEFRYKSHKCVVTREPYYYNEMIYVIDSESGRWELVFCNGKISKCLYVV